MRVLTAYFSHSGENYFSGEIKNVDIGNTAIVAQKTAEITGSELFEIKRTTPYPVKYRDCVNEAVRELKENARPELAESVDVSAYDVIVLEYPNWCGTMPMPVFTFLESGDFTGKKILPLCTNEGSGTGRSVSDIKKICPSSVVADGLSVKGGNARECDAQLKAWLGDNGII